jgi:hypothetical protein
VAKEAEEGEGEVRHWPSKPERNRSSLDQIGSKTLKKKKKKKKKKRKKMQ